MRIKTILLTIGIFLLGQAALLAAPWGMNTDVDEPHARQTKEDNEAPAAAAWGRKLFVARHCGRPSASCIYIYAEEGQRSAVWLL